MAIQLGRSAAAVYEEAPLRRVSVRGTARAYLELSKARLSAMVVLTTAVGYVMAGPVPFDTARFLLTIIGTCLAAWGANALNQWHEADRDALMLRTRTRPLPAGRIGRSAALAYGLIVGLAGPALLAATVSPAAAVLALVTLVVYVLIYTPMKVRTPLNTLVGAVVGAIPPVIGWVAAVERFEAGAWIIGGILFLWQIPHFLALAWLYREDYARGGFRMLPAVDPSGRLTGYVSVAYSLLLIPLASLLSVMQVATWWYGLGAILAGAGLTAASVAFERDREDAAARRLFVVSLVYLPVLLALMVAGRAP